MDETTNVGGEYVLTSGKFEGCRLREVNRDELSFEVGRRGPLNFADRAAIREYIALRRRRQLWIGGRRDQARHESGSIRRGVSE
jgi:hypothetical protein